MMKLKKDSQKGTLLNFAGIAVLFAALLVFQQSSLATPYMRGILIQCCYVIIMVGAYVVWISTANFGFHPIVSILLAVVVSTVLGVVIEKVAYAPLRSSPRLSLLITAIGISFLLENGFQLIFGAGAKVVPDFLTGPSVHLGSATISFSAIVTIVVTVAMPKSRNGNRQ